MKTKKLLLSAITFLAFLTSGCDENTMKDGGDVPTVTPPVKVDPYKTAGWYGKTEVSATAADGKVYSHKSAGVFGELVQSSDDKDKHDIPGYGAAILQVIFVPEFTTDMDVGYFSDYKKYDEAGTPKKVWTFQVKNQQIVDLSSAPIIINLNGVHDVQYRDDRGRVEYKESSTIDQAKVDELRLVDVDNNNSYTVNELAIANLTMQGLHTRTFRWVLGSVDSSDYNALPSAQRASARVASSDFQVVPVRVDGGKFGLPPM